MPGPALRDVGAELVAIARELVRIPVELFMLVAEFAGANVLRAWLIIWPRLQAVWHLAVAGFERAQREITPARATVAVALVAALGLGVSQFLDYSATQIGAPQYSGVELVAPAPVAGEASAGSAHLWIGLPLAVLAVAAIVLAARGRPSAARLLIPIGLAVIVVSVVVDAPKGLDEGENVLLYSGAEASLRSGFWVQLISGGLLALLAPVLVRSLDPDASDGHRLALRRRLRPAKVGN